MTRPPKPVSERTLRRRYRAAIAAAAEAAARQPMRWGVDDCMLFIANIDRAVTGIDPAASFRGRYRTRVGAARVMGKRGLAGAAHAAARRCGWRPLVGSPKAGDRALVMRPEGITAMIFNGAVWLGRGADSVVGDLRPRLLRVWSIA